MSLLRCPECNSSVSSQALRCQKCGLPADLFDSMADTAALPEDRDDEAAGSGVGSDATRAETEAGGTRSGYAVPLSTGVGAVALLGLLIAYVLFPRAEEPSVWPPHDEGALEAAMLSRYEEADVASADAKRMATQFASAYWRVLSNHNVQRQLDDHARASGLEGPARDRIVLEFMQRKRAEGLPYISSRAQTNFLAIQERLLEVSGEQCVALLRGELDEDEEIRLLAELSEGDFAGWSTLGARALERGLPRSGEPSAPNRASLERGVRAMLRTLSGAESERWQRVRSDPGSATDEEICGAERQLRRFAAQTRGGEASWLRRELLRFHRSSL